MGTNHQEVSPIDATGAQVANDRITTASATNETALPHPPTISKQMDKCYDISTPLLSVNKLCQGDLAALFHGEKATVFKPTTSQLPLPIHGKQVLEGKLDTATELHMVDIPTNSPCKL